MKTIGSVGEKELIRSILVPAFNPEAVAGLPGDDCGVAWLAGQIPICISTDRVPWDLISFQLGLINIKQLGRYLVVLNLSDLAAMGADPIGIVLNLAFPATFPLSDFTDFIEGVQEACIEFGCRVLGGDLSDAVEPSLAATVIGTADRPDLLFRSGSQPGDLLYVSGEVGLTATAFSYFMRAEPAGLKLNPAEEDLLIRQFSDPAPRVSLGKALRNRESRITCMDNTDGAGQTLSELAQASELGFELYADRIPINDVSYKVANFLELDPVDMVMGPGADFQLIGTVPGAFADGVDLEALGMYIIGRSTPDPGGIVLRYATGEQRGLTIAGWNYFTTVQHSAREAKS